jgi:sugar O-acyltransferase (sialic acid O-acetyltransferase NeuD family)
VAKPLLLVGCGGHGRVVLDAALASGLDVEGIVDNALVAGQAIFGVPVLGGDEILESAMMVGAGWLNGIGANPQITQRRTVFATLSARFEPIGVRHPGAAISRPELIGAGVQLMAGTIVQLGCQIGENSVVNTGATIDHDCQIGANCFVAPNATLCGAVTLGQGVFVGAAAVILPGIAVDEDAIIGAGAVVTRNVAARAIMAGNPARLVGWNEK